MSDIWIKYQKDIIIIFTYTDIWSKETIQMHCFCITTFSRYPPPQHKLCWDIQCLIKKKNLFYLTAKSSSNETLAFSHHSLLQQKFAHSLSWLKNIKTFNNYIKYDKATFIFVSMVWECKLWFNKYWIILYVYSKQSIKFTTVWV